jgi:hypothetical protein
MVGNYCLRIACAGFLVCSLVPVTGCGKSTSPVFSTVGASLGGGGGAADASKKSELSRPADFTLDANAWHAEWKKDSEAAAKKYKGKIVELTGVVDHPDDDPYCRVGYIWLKPESGILGVRCALDDTSPWLKVGPGCKIKIKGQVPEFGLAGDLYPCVIVESDPNPILLVAASQLAKDFAADKKQAASKYHEKWLIVDGEFVSKEPSAADEGRFIYVTLKGDGGVNVRCYLSNMSEEQKKRNDGLKPGQKLKICGEGHIDESSKQPELSKGGGCMVTVVR